MTDILRCCPPESTNQPYIGVDQKCTQPAIFCIEHTPHKNSEGLMHQMLPLKHFKKTLQEKKFRMNEKIGVLIDQYNALMDALIEEIRELKLRKNIEFSMLWLRQLARDQEQYQLMRQVYRMDFKDLTCAIVHSIYFKIVHNQILEKKSVKEIDCYKGISQILEHLSQEKQTMSFLSKKIAQIEGILENGEILKRALPDKVVFKQNIKEVLLQSPFSQSLQLKYNKCLLIKPFRQYISIFSKYPIVPNVQYHINFQTKYTNVMLGVCTQKLKQQSKGIMEIDQNEESMLSHESSYPTEYNKHYSKESLVFNCTNGCVYKDGMFESGSNVLTKGQKELVLKLRVTATSQLIVMLGKHVLCRQSVEGLLQRHGRDNQLFLHVLMRTQGDCFDVDRDKDVSSDQLPPKIQHTSQQQVPPKQSRIDYQQIKRRNEDESMLVNSLKQQILSNPKSPNNISDSSSYDFRHLDSSKLIQRQESNEPLRENRSQQKLRQEAVKNEVRKIQEKRKEQLKEEPPRGNLMNLPQEKKEQKINQIIKRQRIDKILNDIKSKPLSSSSKDNPVIARKLKQIQQKNLPSNNPKETPSWRKPPANPQQNISLSSQPEPPQPANLLIPQTYSNALQSNSSFQGSSQFVPSPMLPSTQIDPLLILQKRKSSQKSGEYQYDAKFSAQRQPQYSEEQSSYQQEQPQPLKLNKKTSPSQKYFNFQQDESYQFDGVGSEEASVQDGGFTPIDKIKDFEFAKRSGIMKSTMNDKLASFPPIKQQNQHKASSQVRDQSSSQQQMRISNSKGCQQSQVLQSFDVNNDRTNQPLINVKNSGMKMPELNHSHFSKLTSKSNLHDSAADSSFGLDRFRRLARPNLQQSDSSKPPNPMQKMNMLQSIINIRSDQKSSPDDSSAVHLGNILQPKFGVRNQLSQDSSITDGAKSFEMGSEHSSNYQKYQ